MKLSCFSVNYNTTNQVLQTKQLFLEYSLFIIFEWQKKGFNMILIHDYEIKIYGDEIGRRQIKRRQ